MEKAAAEQAAAEQAAAEKAAAEQAAAEKAAAPERAAAEKAAAEKAAAERAAAERARLWARYGKATPEKATPEKAAPERAAKLGLLEPLQSLALDADTLRTAIAAAVAYCDEQGATSVADLVERASKLIARPHRTVPPSALQYVCLWWQLPFV